VPDFDTQDYLSRIRAELQAGLDALAVVNQPIYDMDAIYAELQSSGIPMLRSTRMLPAAAVCATSALTTWLVDAWRPKSSDGHRYSPDPGVLVIADNTITRQDPPM